MLGLKAKPRGVQENSCITETALVLGIETSRTLKVCKLCLLDALKVAGILHSNFSQEWECLPPSETAGLNQALGAVEGRAASRNDSGEGDPPEAATSQAVPGM